MKKTKKFLSIAALALVGAMMTGCSNDDNFDNPQQPENKNNVVTLTTTIGLDDGGTTRALTATGVKTFAAGDQIAVIYTNTSDQTVKVLSEALPAGDYGKNATFTVTLTNPKASGAVRYIYPAAMAATTVETSSEVNADANVKYSALATQNGTLATLASTLDLAIFDGSLTAGAALPASATMENQLAILAVTLKNEAGSSEITSTITGMTVSDGTNTYTVSRSAAAGSIYVAIRPTADATINITAKTSTGYHVKTLTGKTYAKNNGYNVSWKMTALPEGTLPGKFTINAGGSQVRFSKGNLQATYNGSAWSWAFAANQWDYIGNAAANTSINGNGTVSANGTVDLFGWVGASSSWTGAAQYGISNSNATNSTNGYGNVANEALKSDWGKTIDGSGNTWRTLTITEWNYLFSTRTDAASKFGHGKVNNVNGMIILPDSWTLPSGLSFTAGASAWSNSYTTEQWAQMESAGAVFLPAAGYRNGSSFSNTGSNGYYWFSSPYASDVSSAYFVSFGSGTQSSQFGSRSRGRSVRLVRAVE